MLAQASGPALDLIHDEMVIVNAASNSITTFARTASGNTAPLRVIQGVNTGLTFSTGVAVDLVHDEIFVTNQTSSSVTVYRSDRERERFPPAGPSRGTPPA